MSSGLEFTILQPTNYMLAQRLRPAFEHGGLRLSWSLERCQSLVDLEGHHRGRTVRAPRRANACRTTYEFGLAGEVHRSRPRPHHLRRYRTIHPR